MRYPFFSQSCSFIISGLAVIGFTVLITNATLAAPRTVLTQAETNNQPESSIQPLNSEQSPNGDQSENSELKTEVIRLSGKNRFETSRLIAEKFHEGITENVILVSGNQFPDALSAAPLAAKLKAPILLWNQDIRLSGDAVEYITKHLSKEGTLYIVGGQTVIGGAEELQGKGYQVKRIAGDSRYETNLEVVKALNLDEGTPLFMASGEDFADALSVSSIAASLNYPILLASGEGIPPESQAYLHELQPQMIYLIGGEGVIAEEVLEGIKEWAPETEIKRLAGRDRFATGVEVIKEFIDEPSQLFFASGYNFADALSGSVYAAQTFSPIVLVDTQAIEPPLAVDVYLNELFQSQKLPEIAVLGGSRIITNALAETLSNTVSIGYESEQLKSYREMAKMGFIDYSKLTRPKPNQREYLTISAIGDNTLGTDPRYAYGGSLPQAFDQYGPAYFFSGVKEILAQDDLTIANLESVLTQANELSDKSAYLYRYWFKGDPAYVEILKEGSIEAVNLANNHIMDFKDKGYQDTLEVLENRNISYFGSENTAILKKKGIKLGLFGLNLVDFKETAANLEKVKKEISMQITELKMEAQVVIVSFHWGSENSYQVKEVQKKIGRFAIDQGADLVLGHHPHVLEPVERYKGKYIVYSLGNFVFGGNQNPWDKDTIIFQQSLEVVNGELWGFTEPKVIPAKVSSVNSRNDYKPMVVTEPSEVNRILKKVGLPK